jgi:hypothetical protein
MAPQKRFLAFVLVAKALASFFTTMPSKGRPVTDPQNNAAIEYVSLRSLLFKVIFAPVTAVTLGASNPGRILNGGTATPTRSVPSFSPSASRSFCPRGEKLGPYR